MKRKIVLLFVVLLALAVQGMAQTNKNRTVSIDNYAEVYTTDIVLAGNDSLLNFAVNFQTDVEYFYDIVLNLDSTASTSAASVQLQGKLWDSDSYADIGSAVTWAGTSADTTIKFSQHSTAQFYQYLRLVVDGDSCTVDFIKERIWK